MQSTMHFTSGIIPDAELSTLYNEDDFGRKIVRTYPDTAWREGFELRTEEDDAKTAILDAFREWNGAHLICEADCLGRAYGGAAIVLGVEDGRAPTLPLDRRNIESISYLRVADRRQLTPWSVDTDFRSRTYGETLFYRYRPAVRLGSQEQLIHRSRLILFGGVSVDDETRALLNGWEYSIFQLVYKALRDENQAGSSLTHLLSDISQAVIRLAGLTDAISNGFESKVVARVQFLNLTRSLLRTIVLDADGGEDYKREPTPLAGVAEVADRIALRLCAAAEIPYSILFGRGATGLNATGDADLELFYGRVADRQKKHIEPRLRALLEILCLAKDGPTHGELPSLGIEWPSLVKPSDKEIAEREKIIAEADKIRIETQQCTPEEIALSRFGKDGFSAHTVIDRKGREELLAQEQNATTVAKAAQKAGDLYAYDLEFGISTRNEIRARKGLPPIEGGDVPPQRLEAAPEGGEESTSTQAPPVDESTAANAAAVSGDLKKDQRNDSRKGIPDPLDQSPHRKTRRSKGRRV